MRQRVQLVLVLAIGRCSSAAPEPEGMSDRVCGLNDIKGKHFAKTKAYDTSTCTTIKLNGNPGDFKALLAAIQKSNMKLMKLDMSFDAKKKGAGTALGDDEAELVAGVLRKRHVTSALQRVLLRGNNIGDRGAIALSDAVRERGIQWLQLRDNKIKSKGAKALASVQASIDVFNGIPLKRMREGHFKKVELEKYNLGKLEAHVIGKLFDDDHDNKVGQIDVGQLTSDKGVMHALGLGTMFEENKHRLPEYASKDPNKKVEPIEWPEGMNDLPALKDEI